jgi:hypothetical protein
MCQITCENCIFSICLGTTADTVVVLTINHADQGLGDVTWMTPLAPYEKSQVFGFRGEYGRKAET